MNNYYSTVNLNELAQYLNDTLKVSNRYIALILLNHDNLKKASSRKEYYRYHKLHMYLYKRALKQ